MQMVASFFSLECICEPDCLAQLGKKSLPRVGFLEFTFVFKKKKIVSSLVTLNVCREWFCFWAQSEDWRS